MSEIVPWTSPGGEPCCCDEECCLYPLEHLGVLYNADDLPDAVSVNLIGNSNYPVTVPRSGTSYIIEGDFEDPPSVDVYIAPEFEGDYWLKEVGYIFGWNFSSECLIDTSDPDEEAVCDLFEDTYTVGAVTLVRESLCVWRGGGRILRYNSTTCKWTLDGVEKTAPQSSPAGTYGAETIS